MKQNYLKTVFSLFAAIFLLYVAPAMGETGTAFPVIGKGEGFLKTSAVAPVATSTNTMGEMGMALPVIGEGEGLLKAAGKKSAIAPVATSTKTMGEMGTALPVIGKGEGFLEARKKATFAVMATSVKLE